ncbi:hypothetical protein [Photobacterium sp. R1]
MTVIQNRHQGFILRLRHKILGRCEEFLFVVLMCKEILDTLGCITQQANTFVLCCIHDSIDKDAIPLRILFNLLPPIFRQQPVVKSDIYVTLLAIDVEQIPAGAAGIAVQDDEDAVVRDTDLTLSQCRERFVFAIREDKVFLYCRLVVYFVKSRPSDRPALDVSPPDMSRR